MDIWIDPCFDRTGSANDVRGLFLDAPSPGRRNQIESHFSATGGIEAENSLNVLDIIYLGLSALTSCSFNF